MATVAPSGNGTHTAVARNNGGTAIGVGGKGTDSKITKALDVYQLADDVGADIGSKVVAKTGTGANTTDRVGVAKVVTAGTLAFTPTSSQWIMQGVSTTIGGIANTTLESTGSDWDGMYYDNIHQLLKTRALGSGSNTTFNFLAKPNGTINPNFTKGTGAGNSVVYIAPSGGIALDDAATPTRSVPGELTYRFGGPLPNQDNYKAKDTYES